MGYKQRHVARLLGLYDAKPLYEWEHGISMPSPINLLKLSLIYHTYPNELYHELYLKLQEEVRALELSLFAEE